MDTRLLLACMTVAVLGMITAGLSVTPALADSDAATHSCSTNSFWNCTEEDGAGAQTTPGTTTTTTTTTTSAINDEISLQKTVVQMNIPEDNQLPWGTVSGVASNHVSGYPMIIQFLKAGSPVHVAQVGVQGDGSYEYKFRIRNLDVNTGQFINIFEGQYTVKIFNVIPNTDGRA